MYLIEANVKQTTCLLVCTCRSGFKKQIILFSILTDHSRSPSVIFTDFAKGSGSKRTAIQCIRYDINKVHVKMYESDKRQESVTCCGVCWVWAASTVIEPTFPPK